MLELSYQPRWRAVGAARAVCRVVLALGLLSSGLRAGFDAYGTRPSGLRGSRARQEGRVFAGVYLDAIRRGLTGSRVSVGVHRDEDAVLTFSVREELDGVRFARTVTARPQRTA